ncbi:hypothetical protein [Nocardia grenadensis]|uniref:hypothetical protein n=1 Tax=Nocardia grenadensis TaxID=931537 RepID=UPI003D723427
MVGSAAFEPVLRGGPALRAALSGAGVTFGFEGSERGTARLEEEAGGPRGLLAVGDAPKGADYPALVQRPPAVSLLSVVVHPSAGVRESDGRADPRFSRGGCEPAGGGRCRPTGTRGQPLCRPGLALDLRIPGKKARRPAGCLGGRFVARPVGGAMLGVVTPRTPA